MVIPAGFLLAPGQRTRVTGVRVRGNKLEQEQEIIINIGNYIKLMNFPQKPNRIQSTSKYLSEGGVYFLCASLIEHQMCRRGRARCITATKWMPGVKIRLQ
jgi:hypothetical protein